MTEPIPPHGQQRPPQVWGTRFDQRKTAPPGFGPAPQVFGPPPDAPAGGGPAAPGPRRRRKALAIGLGLLLVAGVGTGGWLLWGRGNDPAPKPKKNTVQAVDAKLDWMAPVPDADKDKADRIARPWFAKDVIVLPTRTAVTAYDSATGKPRWTLPVPGTACTSSPRSDQGVAVVVYGKAEFECNLVMAVDLEHGRALWNKELTDSKGRKDSHGGANISFSEGAVTLTEVLEPRVYETRTGERRKSFDFGCAEQGTVVDRSAQLTIAQCQIFDRYFVMNVDPKTGVEKWTWKVLDGLKVQNILSVNPPVLTVAREHDTGASDMVVLDDKGRLKQLISVSSGPYDLDDCKPRQYDSCRRAVVDGNTLFLPTRHDKGPGNAVAAIDLNTGKPRWTSEFGADRTHRPVAMQDGRLLVYQEATREESGKLLSVDPANGNPQVLMKLPQESAEREFNLARYGDVYFRDGRLYLVTNYGMTDPSLMMVFH
ncbi:outer membrane protein assembly factor BamB family protein [Streptomyces cinnamoneus]|uniref:Pyrrolo-quinoline quinone repeat domain-containing protein n=1 Tax=Streptomyces cinnamoneus TaxID=53446 RepID=A0A918WPX2_STRCJ|nr:PQQ-binding-like beta-propeller repeat protein [Streptomyces cinnamoneus]GHC71802.1 hypothetical protein GCM10010507_58550 [Streptomyces cinnamoneus]